MGGRGADNTPGPARRRRASLAGRVRGGRGEGDVEGGGGAPALQTKNVLRAPARAGAGGRGGPVRAAAGRWGRARESGA